MTFFEKLAEKVGVKEAIRSMYNSCPCRYFMGLSEFCPEHRCCSSCWCEEWEGQEIKDTGKEKVIYPGDIVAVETPDGFKIGRVKKADRFVDVWLDQTNVPAIVNGRVKKADRFVDVWLDQTNVPAIVKRNYVHKIINAHVITDEVLGGTDEEVEKGLRDAYKV